jgi:hypothetical protein
MSKSRKESLDKMSEIAFRLGCIVVDLQVKKAQMKARGDTSPKGKTKP